MIIDDVKPIRDGLKRTLLSAFPELRIWTAESAVEALKLIPNLALDIVLLDIMMPGMTGLELLKAGRSLDKRIRWVVISAHSQFEYAQEAMRFGAKDYLLKPIGKPKLIDLIARLGEEIRDERAEMTDQETLSRSLKYLQEAVFQRWITGLGVDGFDVSRLAEEYGAFRLVVVCLQHVRELELHHFTVDNVVTELIAQVGKGFVTSYADNKLVGLLEDVSDAAANAFESRLRDIFDRALKHTYSLMVSPSQSEFSAIPALARNMLSRTDKLLSALDLHGDEALPPGGVDKASSGGLVRDDGRTEIMDVAAQYIKAHFHENMSLEKVASAVYLNPSYFSLMFKQKMGFGYKDYVIHLRMEKAKTLLRQSHLKVSDVAEQVGYTDMRHFTQVFRKTFQMTPSEYRATLGEPE